MGYVPTAMWELRGGSILSSAFATILVHNRNLDIISITHGHLDKYVKLWVAHAPRMSKRFPRHRGLAIPTCIATCVMHGWIANYRFLCCRWGKRSRHSRRMHNPQFYVSGKRPMEELRGWSALGFVIHFLAINICQNAKNTLENETSWPSPNLQWPTYWHENSIYIFVSNKRKPLFLITDVRVDTTGLRQFAGMVMLGYIRQSSQLPIGWMHS